MHTCPALASAAAASCALFRLLGCFPSAASLVEGSAAASASICRYPRVKLRVDAWTGTNDKVKEHLDEHVMTKLIGQFPQSDNLLSW